MKFKGQTIKSPKQKQYILKDQFGQGGFSIIFSTSDPQTVCKVQVLNNPQIINAYKNQKQSLQILNSNKYIVKLKDSFQIKQGNDSYGFLMFQNCNSGNTHNILQKHQNQQVSQKLVLKVFYSVASALEYIHQKNIIHRDIKLENLLLNSKGQFKLCDFGSSSKQIIFPSMITKESRPDIQQYIQKTTTPFYRSPQQLDLYSGYQIGPKVDVFAMGVLIFMLCFKKPPFQTRLSSINTQYFIPEQTSFSKQLIQLIQKCFISNPTQRISSSQVKKQIKQLMNRKVAQIDINLQKQLSSTLNQILKINNSMLKKSNQTVQSSIFDKIKRIYNQITTQTQGWIAGFVQDNQQAPQLKYNRSILSKCWQKRYKVQKMYQILDKYSQDYKNKCIVNVKLLILLHNFLRKGPPQSINYDGKFSVPKLCSKIYRNWKITQKPTDSQDIKRNSYLCLIIRYYSLILMTKWKISYENSQLIQGNYSILPFLKSNKRIPLLKLSFIEKLIQFLQICIQFHQIISSLSYLIDIQRSIILSLIDQEYCCISLLVFLIKAFKQAVCHFKTQQEQLDLDKLQKKLKSIERNYQSVFKKLVKVFESANKLASLFQQQTPFNLNIKILDMLRNINIREKKKGPFQFNKHINYQENILGLKIPLSYQQAVKNPNFLKNLEKKDDSNVVQVNQFKMKKNCNSLMASNVELKIQQNISKTQQNKFPASLNGQINNQMNKINQDSFKKNKQTREGSQNIYKTIINNGQNSKIQTKQKDGNLLMQFTHQNLNKDMVDVSQTKKEQRINKQSKFKDFLSIVEDKMAVNSLNNLNNSINIPKVMNGNQRGINNNFNFNNFQKFTGSINQSEYSKISSVNSNVFGNQIQSQNNNQKQQNKFQMFSKMDFVSSSSQYQQKDNQVKKQIDNNLKRQIIQKNPQNDSIFSSVISNVSKQVYNSINLQKYSNKKIELINFFDDQEQDQTSQKINNNNNKIDNQIFQTSIDKNQISVQPSINQKIHFEFMNKTMGAEDRSFNKNQTQNFNKSKQADSLLNLDIKFEVNEKQFKTMPTHDYNFVDLKGFIVQQVRKNAQQYFIQFSNLKFFGKVGFGHSSQVFKGQWRGRQVAIKRIKDNMSPTNAKQFKRQIMTSVKIRHHPNLVTLIGIAQYQNQYYIINEFCNGSTLFQFLHENNLQIPIKAKINISKQIAKGMLFLHTNDPPIIHRDLKSLNVLLVNKYNGQLQPQIKIADFGLSRDFASTYMTGTLGTYHWMAPQIFNNQPYTLKADVYSFAIVLWQILSQSPPYTNIKNPPSLMKFITLQNGRPDLNMISNNCPNELKMLMIRCWDKIPQNRPNFKQILDTLNYIQNS